jgi:peptide/nickel transport system substrate-binding protein
MRKRKLVWLLASCLMVLSLVMTSCGTASEEDEGGTIEEEEAVTALTPKYGGTLNVITDESTGFDPRKVMVHFTRTLPVSHETLLMGDWAKGPAGTGETDWRIGYLGDVSLLTGCLAESWELKDDETLVYHIREGVKWQDKPPVNGREFTSQDAAWNLEIEWRTTGSNLDIFFRRKTT